MSYQQLWQQLARTYDTGEAKAIARMLYEVRYGLSLSDLLMGRDADVPQQELQQLTERLEQHEPIQYVLGQADFCGRTFKVSPAVLIPRPETEELCQWVTTEVRDSACNDAALSILDVGTGSGCIAITLAAELPEAKVTAWDISEDALLVACENALLNGVTVDFELQDVLLATAAAQQTKDIIISNPPYIPTKTIDTLMEEVRFHDPKMALDGGADGLFFYRRIIAESKSHITLGGWLIFEIGHDQGETVSHMMMEGSYTGVRVIKDLSGLDRVVVGTWHKEEL